MADGGSIDWEDELFRHDASEVSDTESDDDQVIFITYTTYLRYSVRQKCDCKSTCQRANRCPCKKEGRHCTARCRCKSKAGPCKNRPRETTVHGGAENSTSTSRVIAENQTNKERVKVRSNDCI